MENTHTHTPSFICPLFHFNSLLFVVVFLLLLLFWVLFVANLSSFGALDFVTFSIFCHWLWDFLSIFCVCLSSDNFLCKPCQFLKLPDPLPHFFFYCSFSSYTVRITFSELLIFLNYFHLPESHAS